MDSPIPHSTARPFTPGRLVVPEPLSAALVGVGLLALAAVRRRIAGR